MKEQNYKIILREFKINALPNMPIAAHLYWSLEDESGFCFSELHGFATKNDEPLTVGFGGEPLKAFLYHKEGIKFEFDEKYTKIGFSHLFNQNDKIRTECVGKSAELLNKWNDAIEMAGVINVGKNVNTPYKYDLLCRNSNSVAKTFADAMNIVFNSDTNTPGDQYSVFHEVSEENQIETLGNVVNNVVNNIGEQNCTIF